MTQFPNWMKYANLSKEDRRSVRQCNYIIARYHGLNVNECVRLRDFSPFHIALYLKSNSLKRTD